MARSSLPVPAPLEGNDRLITLVISAGWAVALIVLLAVRDQMPPAERWWIWVAATGLGLGIFALFFVPWLKRSREHAAAQRETPGR
jgi:NO-binding membrane sensor protein with MHYT domain